MCGVQGARGKRGNRYILITIACQACVGQPKVVVYYNSCQPSGQPPLAFVATLLYLRDPQPFYRDKRLMSRSRLSVASPVWPWMARSEEKERRLISYCSADIAGNAHTPRCWLRGQEVKSC